MTRLFRHLAIVVVCLIPAAIAFSQTTAAPAKPAQPAAQAAAQSSPNQMTTNPGGSGQPALVPPTADDIKRCGSKVPEGGVPTFLRPETPEKRKERIGLPEDPGCDPDPKQVFWRFGKPETIVRYERIYAAYDNPPDANYIRPFGYGNFYYELYQQNEKSVWVWEPVREQQTEANAPVDDIHKSTAGGHVYTDQEVEVLNRLRSEYFPVTPAASSKTLRFEDASNGLPSTGSWRNGLAVADMNGDGFPDIIAPAERAGGFFPTIFLGDGKGNWKVWDVKWPHPIAYGSVVAADFNKDGKMDLAFAAHLDRLYVLLGDGKGKFTDSDAGLPKEFGARRVKAADVNGDGWTDLVAISEGPTAVQSAPEAVSQVRVYLNEGKGKSWKLAPVSTSMQRVAGDYLSIGDFNGDKRMDVATANIYQGSPATMFLGQAGTKWAPLDPQMGRIIPFLSYYYANAAGKFTSTKRDDAIVSYVRIWPTDVNPKLVATPPLTRVTGIDRLSFEDGQPKRTPIMRWGNNFGVNGIAAGDFDGDGKLDIAFTNFESPEKRNLTILLGDGQGGFRRATIEGVTLPARSTYDLTAADVNGDGRPDLIVMFEADESGLGGTKTGSIHVLLNRGVK